MNDDTCTTLLADDAFRSFVNVIGKRCLTWEEFLALPQPRDMSPLQTWGVLNDLSRCLGVPINIPDLEDNTYFYRRTHELNTTTELIACACRAGSRLDTVMNAAAGKQFLTASKIEETLAAAQLDGLAISEEDAKVLLRLDRTPQDDTARLLVNIRDAFDHVPDLVEERFSLDLLHHLRDLILKDVDPGALRRQTPSVGILLGAASPDERKSRLLAGQQIERITAYANGETADPHDIPVLRSIVISDAMRYYSPLGPVSSQVGRLAERLYAIKNGFPVLGLLPLSRVKIDWEKGLIAPPRVSFDRNMYVTLRERSPFDSTAHQTLAAQLTLVALGNLEKHIDGWEKQDEEMRLILHRDPLLNHRQRTILARALRNPEAEFRIRYHQMNHNIHYTTARRDLLELQEKGYLSMVQRGKAFMFLRGPKLRELERARAANATARAPASLAR